MQRATTVKTMRTLKMKRKREKKHLSPSSRVLRSRLNSLECLTPTCCSFSSRGVQALPCFSTRMPICIWMSCLFSTTLLLKMGRPSEKLRAFFLATIEILICFYKYSDFDGVSGSLKSTTWLKNVFYLSPFTIER